MAGGGKQQRQGHLGDRIGVAGRGVEHRNTGGGSAGNVDVIGISPGGGYRSQPKLEHRAGHRITFHHNHISGFGGDPIGQLVGGVDAQWGLFYPRVVDHVCQLPELGETCTLKWGGYQSARMKRHDS